jgi:sporulation protein YlmC with PRC-barrel domain
LVGKRKCSSKMLTNEIVGLEVLGSKGFKLGKKRDTDFDVNTWKLNSLEVQLDKDVAEEHHLRHRFRKARVLIYVDHVQGLGDKVILKGPKEDLLKLIASATSTVPEEQKEQREIPETIAGSLLRLTCEIRSKT